MKDKSNNKMNYFAKISSVLLTAGIFLTILFMYPNSVRAEITLDDLLVSHSLGKIDDLRSGYIFAANLMKYIGWSGVTIGVLGTISLLIYRLITADDDETFKKLQAGVVKAIIIIVIGFCILAAGVFVSIITNLTGAPDLLLEMPK